MYDVVIIGAGWSGLAASNYLIDAGITNNLLVVEARDRIGGRSNTIENAFKEGYPVEEGSQWIYSGTYLWDLVNSLGIAHDPSIWEWDTLGLYEEVDGPLSQTEQETFINDVYRKDFMPYAYKNAAFNKNWTEILSEYYRDRGDKLTSTDRQAINALVTAGIIIEYGSPINETNSEDTKYNLGRGDWRSIDNMAVAGGTGGGYTAAITKGLADNLAPDQILLNSPVTKIDRTSGFGTVKISISKNDGGEESVIQAKSVLVTVPVGVLKQSTIEFLPKLSSKKLEAIDMIPVGTLNKVIMYWDQSTQDISWWPDGQVDMNLITKEDISSNDFTYFYNDHEHVANKDYYTMTAFIGGKAAEFYESYSDEETIELVLNNVRKMFGQDVPRPNQYFVSRWKSDKYANGAYSFDLVGSYTRRFRFALAEPVGKNLFFAGEATDTDGWYATTVGAYSTGIKASDLIAQSGVLSSNQLQPTCTPLNAECGTESNLTCCNGLVCASYSIVRRSKLCLLSTVVRPRPSVQPEESDLSDPVEISSDPTGVPDENDASIDPDETNKSSSPIIFSELILIGLTTTLTFVMTTQS